MIQCQLLASLWGHSKEQTNQKILHHTKACVRDTVISQGETLRDIQTGQRAAGQDPGLSKVAACWEDPYPKSWVCDGEILGPVSPTGASIQDTGPSPPHQAALQASQVQA